MFENILLEPEQEELLVKLVEASRNVPRERRQRFQYSVVVGSGDPSDPRATIFHDGFPSGDIRAHLVDIEVLVRNELLIRQLRNPMAGALDVAPQGFRYYEHLKIKLGQPVERIQSTVHNYLSSEQFQRDFPTAYRKWTEAEVWLWSTDWEAQLSTIGHLCREAMQEFASELGRRFNPPNFGTNVQHVVARVRAVLEHRGSTLGSTERAFLDALLPYWGTVVDLVQRQEHAGQKEGESIVWEDGRRVVFQTAVVMFEIARALARGSVKG